MNLYLLEREGDGGYDTFNAAVVVAGSEAEARRCHPSGELVWQNALGWIDPDSKSGWVHDDWIAPEQVQVTFLGPVVPGITGVVCADFHAG